MTVINLASGLTQSVTLSASTAFTFSNWPAGASQATVIVIENGTGGYTATFSGVTWVGNTPSQNTAANAVSIYSFLSPNGGTTVYGAGAANSVTGVSGADIFDWNTSAGTKVVYLDSTGRAHFVSGAAIGNLVLAGTSIYGANGNVVANAQDTVSAVNFVNFNSAVAGNGPGVSPGGSDTNIDFGVIPVGTGNVNLGGPAVTTTSPTAGTAGALPAKPTAYAQVKFNGTQYKVAVY